MSHQFNNNVYFIPLINPHLQTQINNTSNKIGDVILIKNNQPYGKNIKIVEQIFINNKNKRHQIIFNKQWSQPNFPSPPLTKITTLFNLRQTRLKEQQKIKPRLSALIQIEKIKNIVRHIKTILIQLQKQLILVFFKIINHFKNHQTSIQMKLNKKRKRKISSRITITTEIKLKFTINHIAQFANKKKLVHFINKLINYLNKIYKISHYQHKPDNQFSQRQLMSKIPKKISQITKILKVNLLKKNSRQMNIFKKTIQYQYFQFYLQFYLFYFNWFDDMMPILPLLYFNYCDNFIKNMNSKKQYQLNESTEFWNKLNTDLDTIAKTNIDKFRKNKYMNLTKRNNISQTVDFGEIKQAANSIRNKNRRKKQQEIKLKTALNYLSIERERRSKTVQLAKRKYQRIIEIRNQTFKEKAILSSERKAQLQQQKKEISEKYSKIRNHRQRLSESIVSCSSALSSEASVVRRQSQQNRQKILNDKLISMSQNRKRVKQIQQNQETGKQQLQSLNRQIKQSGQKVYQNKVNYQYLLFQKQQRTNSMLLEKLKKQAKRNRSERDRLGNELNGLQSFLGIKKNLLPLTGRSNRSQLHRNFYLTNQDGH